MVTGKLLRNQFLDKLPQQLLTGITEDALGLGVDQDDAPLTIHHDHRRRRPFDNTSKGRLPRQRNACMGCLVHARSLRQ